MGAGLIEFGFGVEQSATSTWMCDCIESETRSAYSSIFSTIQSVAGFIIMNLLGVLTEWNGVNAAWCVAAVAMGVDIVILVILAGSTEIVYKWKILKNSRPTCWYVGCFVL